MSKVNVVFTFDENYAPAASVAIQSLLASKKLETEYEIYVVYGNLQDETRKKLAQWHPIHWIKLNLDIFAGLPCSEHYTISAWYSTVVSEVLPDLERVIYSDVDVMFKSDLTELFEMDLHGNCLAAVPVGWNDGTIPHSDKMGRVIFIGDLMVMDIPQMRELHTCAMMFDAAKKYFKDIPCRQMGIMNIISKGIIEPISVKYDIFGVYYHAPEGGISFNDYNDFNTMVAAMQDVRRVHYTVDGENRKIWECPLEEIPEEYRKYLAKSGFCKTSVTAEEHQS